MNSNDLIAALELPPETYLNHSVPKERLLEKGAFTPGDKRQIKEGIKGLEWVAVLKPTTIGIAAYGDETREVLEIAILCLKLEENAKAKRLIELVHRAIPYPVLLVSECGSNLTLSLAQKRWSQGEMGKTVLDGELIEARLDDESNKKFLNSFLKSLTLARQSVKTLFGLYEGWIDRVLALQAAYLTGAFTMPSSEEHASGRRKTLQLCTNLKSQMISLRAAAAKEKQLARQVELNLKLERLKGDFVALCANL